MHTTPPASRFGQVLGGLALAAGLFAGAPAAAGDAPAHAVSLQFLHPIATSPDPRTEATVRLSLLWGRSGAVRALDLGGVAAATLGDVRGVQAVGAYGGVGGDLQGVALTAGVHLVQQDVSGLQSGGVAAWTRGAVAGAQLAGAVSYAASGLNGAQLSGLVSISDGDGGFLQASSVANVAVGEFGGWQLAGFVNSANNAFGGLQTAVLNYSDSGRGAQIGLVNVAREMSGLQLGAINSATTLDGVPVGLVNLTRDNPRDWIVYASTLALASLGFRTEVNGWTSILSAGYGDAQGDESEAGTLAWHYGRRLGGDERRWLGADLGWVHVMPRAESDDPAVNDRLHGALQARLTGDLALSEGVAAWAAVGASLILDEYSVHAGSATELLLAGGVVLR